MAMTAVYRDVFAASETRLLVRFADVDMMRVVHHAAYIHWCEQIRFSFLERILGITAADVEKAGVAFPVMECRLKYHRAIVFDEPVLGYGHIELHRNSMFTFHYEIWSERGDGYLCASGYTLHCFVTGGLQLLLKTPAFMREAFDRACVRYPRAIFESAASPEDRTGSGNG